MTPQQQDDQEFLRRQTFKISGEGSLLTTTIQGSSELSIQLKHSALYDAEKVEAAEEDLAEAPPEAAMEVKNSLFAEDIENKSSSGSVVSPESAAESDLEDSSSSNLNNPHRSPEKKSYSKLKAAQLIRFKKRKRGNGSSTKLLDPKQSSILQFLSPATAARPRGGGSCSSSSSNNKSPLK